MKEPSLRWSDGLYAGLIAGAVLAGFFMLTATFFDHRPALGYFGFIASSVLGAKAATTPAAIALGVGLHFILCALGGILYALVSRRFSGLATAPGSTIGGLVYGLLLWLAFVDVLIPMTGMSATATQPWPETLIGAVVFYGFTLCEYLAIKKHSRSEQSLLV